MLLRFFRRHFRQRLVDFHDFYFVAEAGPAAEHVGIFLGGAAGFFGLPVAQKDVVLLAVAEEQVAAVSLGRDNGAEFTNGDERRGFFFGDRLPDSHR